MGKCKNLRDFDKDQTVMVRRLGQNISRTAGLVGCSWYAVVSTYQKWSKEGQPVNQRQGHGHPTLIDAHGQRGLGTTYLNIVTDQVHPFMVTVFPDGSGLFQQDNAPCHTAKNVQEWFEERDRVQGVALASKFPRFQSDRASVGCAGKTSLILGGPTSQLTGLKGSAANVLVPDTRGHLQRS